MRINFEGDLPNDKLAQAAGDFSELNIFKKDGRNLESTEELVIEIRNNSGELTVFPSGDTKGINQVHAPNEAKKGSIYLDKEGALNLQYENNPYKLRLTPPKEDKKK